MNVLPSIPPDKHPRVLRVACLASLIALGLMAWSLLDPRPLPVMVAMTVAQGLGTLGLATFVVIVAGDLRRAMRAAKRDKLRK